MRLPKISEILLAVIRHRPFSQERSKILWMGKLRLSWKWRGRVKKTRKHYTAEEKVAILRRHLLCAESGLQPTVFYRWQKEFFENGAAAFQPKGRPSPQPQQERIEYLEKKIRTKDEVLAELMAEHIALKESLEEI